MSRSAGHYRHLDDHSFYFYEGEDLICQQDVGALVQDDSQYEPKFLLLDHLGSTRAELVFDPVSLAPQIQEYYDLMPYGEVIDPPSTQESVLFTGKPRDIESGLDIFTFRPYSNQLCRWICADDPFADTWVEDPQSWNLFAYCRNNPITKTDPDGRAVPAILIPALVYVGSNPAVQRAGERALAWTAATLGVVATAAWAATQVSAVNESTGYWGQQHYHKESQADQGGNNNQADQTGDPSPDPAGPEPHGNSKDSQKTQHRYEIVENATGDVAKTGISGQPLNQNGTSPRANPQVNALNQQNGQGTYSARVVETNIPGRKAALASEQAATNQLKAQGNTLGMQKRPQAQPER